MYERFINKGNITLFSPHDVTDMYDAFFADQDKFEELYLKYEQDESIVKRSVPARELFGTLMNERASTGRIYIQNVDHCNTHSAFRPEVAPIRMSNLCMEITLPTKPLSIKDREQGEISLCTLSAVNLGNLDKLDDLKDRTDILVRFLDELLDYQNYPVYEAEKTTKSRRSLGIGVINYAYYLTKHFYTYDEKALELTHDTFEALQYYSLLASTQLAKEKGKCEWFEDTTYSKGILPIDTYKKDLDEVYPPKYKLDWELLRQEILTHGLRNSTLTALMPSECQSKDNMMLMDDGSSVSLREILKDVLSTDIIETIERNGIPQRIPVRPFNLAGNREVNEVYYNGLQDLYEIELEDGSIYKFTANHRLAVKTANGVIWKRVDELTENDEIQTH